MARQLRAKPPTNERVTKPKVLVFGQPGCGKTWVSLDFPKVYYIDTEGGASLPKYQEKLRKAGGVYFGRDEGSNDFQSVIQEVQTLATVKHDYLTLVIDSFSKLYNIASAQAESRVGSDFGKDRKEANKPTRQLMLWLDKLDMNVILICHQKDKWSKVGGELQNLGVTFDGFEKLEYDLHLCLHIQAGFGSKSSTATVHKTRLEGFPRGQTFPWSFQEFAERAGSAVMLRPAAPVDVASKEQVDEVQRLLKSVKVDDDWADKALSKAGVTEWGEMDSEKITKCINFLKDRASGKDGSDA